MGVPIRLLTADLKEPITTGRGRACPYIGKPQNAMDVIGHDNEYIRGHVWEMVRNLVPAIRHNPTEFVASHPVLHDCAKQALISSGSDGHEISSRFRVIEVRQA